MRNSEWLTMLLSNHEEEDRQYQGLSRAKYPQKRGVIPIRLLHYYTVSYYVSKKSWPFLYSKLMYKMGQDFFYRQ